MQKGRHRSTDRDRIAALVIALTTFVAASTAISLFFNAFNIGDSSLLLANPILGDVKCPRGGSFGPRPPPDIVLDKTEIEAHARQSKDHLEKLQRFAIMENEKIAVDVPASGIKEHYALLHYLSTRYGDCRHVAYVGTRHASNVMALSSPMTPVWAFDSPSRVERQQSLMGKTEEVLQREVKTLDINVTSFNLDLLHASNADFSKFMSTWLVVLDASNAVPVEQELIQRLIQMEFKGILLLDGIDLNEERRRWWMELQSIAADELAPAYLIYDITSMGNAMIGMGLLDFSGKVVIHQD